MKKSLPAASIAYKVVFNSGACVTAFAASDETVRHLNVREIFVHFEHNFLATGSVVVAQKYIAHYMLPQNVK